MTLLVVPAPTPFLTITTAYWSARSRSTERLLQDAVAAHRGLIDAAVALDPSTAILRRLARFLDGWAALLDPSGVVDQIHPPALVFEAQALQDDIGRLAVGGIHSASSFVTRGAFVAVLPLPVRDTVVGYLAVGTTRQLDASQRQVVLTAVALLSIDELHTRQQASERHATARCVATLVQLGQADPARQLAAAMGMAPLGREGRVLAVRTRASPALVNVVTSWCREAMAVPLDAQSLWFLLPADHPSVGTLAKAMQAEDESAAGALSDLARLEDLGGCLSRVLPRLDQMSDGEFQLAEHGNVNETREVAELLDDFLDRQEQQVVDALVAYLRHRGHWERAARHLDIHRNTLRYRLSRARSHLGFDLDDPDYAAHLWLQLRARGHA